MHFMPQSTSTYETNTFMPIGLKPKHSFNIEKYRLQHLSADNAKKRPIPKKKTRLLHGKSPD